MMKGSPPGLARGSDERVFYTWSAQNQALAPGDRRRDGARFEPPTAPTGWISAA
jgi:hypothetical protein